MSKTRDNTPELDYFELRRRHEEYKRAKNAPKAEQDSVEERLERQVSQRKARPEAPVQEAPAGDVQDELKVEAKAAPIDAFEEAIEENYEAYDDDVDYDAEGEEEVANPNPFDSFIRFFSNMKSRRSKGDELEDIDLDDLTDEELAELEAEGLLDEDEEFDEVEVSPAPAKSRFSLRRGAQPDEYEAEEPAPAADVEDIDEAPRASYAAEETADGEDFDDEDYGDEDYEDEEYEEELPRKSGFKKFVNLFVTRIDEDEEFGEEDYEDEDPVDEDFDDEDFDDEEEIEEAEEEEAPVRRRFFSMGRKNKARRVEEDEEFYEDLAPEIQISPEGGQAKMDEMNKLAPEAAQAAKIETSGMTRRERRELAMRLAAEEAARKAEEEARAQAEAAPVEPLFTDPEAKEAPVDMAAFDNAPETDLIVETTAEEIAETVDEPTREFTPVSMRDVQGAAEKALFDVDDEDEDEDDEEEIIEKKPRRGLFGRKRVVEEDEDDFDEDDEDEDYDDEDEDDEEEIVEKKPRRGLFGRKRAKDEEDDADEDEDDEDLDDEYDDDDEYDEYDDDEEDDSYDDDDDDEYDDEDYDDDDEPRRSFGHHLIGVLKIVLGLILILLVLVIGLNFHYFITGENTIVTKAHEVLGDSSANDVLCFGYVMRETMPAEEKAAPEVSLEAEITAEPTALPQAEAAIPDLGSNGVIETPVIEAAPVVETAPAVEEAPAVQQAPVTSGSVG